MIERFKDTKIEYSIDGWFYLGGTHEKRQDDDLVILVNIRDNSPFVLEKCLNHVIKDSGRHPKACVIWMHGLGADANDMLGLAEQLPMNVDVKHILMNAPIRPVTLNQHMPMRAWYDIVGLSIEHRQDQAGISQSETMIREMMASLNRDGFTNAQIFLAGFSQGAAMALYTALRTPNALAGVIALSGYLPTVNPDTCLLTRTTPFFIAHGAADPVVLPTWTKQSTEWIKNQGFTSITGHQYPMEHSICFEELRDLSHWFNLHLANNPTIHGSTE